METRHGSIDHRHCDKAYECVYTMRIMDRPHDATLYDSSARKRPTNLSINSDLLEKARALNVNLSRTLEQALVERLARQRREDWIRENHEAIGAYNRRIEAEGSFGDRARRF